MFFGKTTAAGHVKPAEVHDMLDSHADFVLVDVRSKEEHMSANIPGSTLLPLDQLASGAEKVLTSKEKPIVVYCQSGIRSAQAAKVLRKLGFQDVRDMGGITGWPFQVSRGR